MNVYERFCYNLLGDRIKARIKTKREADSALINGMLSARMRISFEAYLATAYISAVAAGLIAALFAALITYLLRLPLIVYSLGSLPEIFYQLSGCCLFIGAVIAAAVAFLIFYAVTWLGFMVYPRIRAGERRRNIDATLPYAIKYITAMSSAGIPPAGVFRLLGESEIYGESAVEARYITREVYIFGKALPEALVTVGRYTPSPRMKDFLQGAVASISSGSNLTGYFRNKSEQYARENRMEQKTFLETLGLISESYVTALVAGTLFLIILQSIMSSISGSDDPVFLYVVIYVIIPLGSLLFVILIDSMTPEI